MTKYFPGYLSVLFAAVTWALMILPFEVAAIRATLALPEMEAHALWCLTFFLPFDAALIASVFYISTHYPRYFNPGTDAVTDHREWLSKWLTAFGILQLMAVTTLPTVFAGFHLLQWQGYDGVAIFPPGFLLLAIVYMLCSIPMAWSLFRNVSRSRLASGNPDASSRATRQ